MLKVRLNSYYVNDYSIGCNSLKNCFYFLNAHTLFFNYISSSNIQLLIFKKDLSYVKDVSRRKLNSINFTLSCLDIYIGVP